MRKFLPLILLIAAQLSALGLTDEQRQVPLERDAPDPTLTKIVLLAGSVSNKPGQHEYFAGCALMMKWLKAQPGVWPSPCWPGSVLGSDPTNRIVDLVSGDLVSGRGRRGARPVSVRREPRRRSPGGRQGAW